MAFLISLLFTLLISYLVYKIFQKYGFAGGFLITISLNLLSEVLQNGSNNFFTTLLSLAIPSLIGTAINFFIYKKTSTFASYIILSSILSFIVSLIVALIGSLFSAFLFTSIFTSL